MKLIFWADHLFLDYQFMTGLGENTWGYPW
jgi:hypothetical protein